MNQLNLFLFSCISEFNKYGFKIVSKKYLFFTSNGSVTFSEYIALSFQKSPKLILKVSFSLSLAKLNTKYVIIVGEEEVKSNILTIKNNQTKEEYKIKQEEMIDFFDHKIEEW